MVSVDGVPAIRLFVYKQSGANTVKVSEAVWEEIAQIQKDYPEIHITATRDTADYIESSISNLEQAAIFGAILAVVVLMFFLRSLASTLIIGTAIPIAIISAFALMYFNGFTLNVISFGGLALGVGMLVDNAIVVLENIYRHRQEGENRREAASKGSREVGHGDYRLDTDHRGCFRAGCFHLGHERRAIPATRMGGFVRAPGLAARRFDRGADASLPLSAAAGGPSGPKRLAWCLGPRGRPALSMASPRSTREFSPGASIIACRLSPAAVFLFAVTIYLVPLIGVELQPEMDEGEVRVRVELEPGTRVEVTESVMQRMAADREGVGAGGARHPGGERLYQPVSRRRTERRQI